MRRSRLARDVKREVVRRMLRVAHSLRSCHSLGRRLRSMSMSAFTHSLFWNTKTNYGIRPIFFCQMRFSFKFSFFVQIKANKSSATFTFTLVMYVNIYIFIILDNIFCFLLVSFYYSSVLPLPSTFTWLLACPILSSSSSFASDSYISFLSSLSSTISLVVFLTFQKHHYQASP